MTDLNDAVRELAVAIAKRDWGGADVALDFLVRSREIQTECDVCGDGTDLIEIIAVARATVNRSGSPPPLAEPDILPRPGHLPGSFEGKPILEPELPDEIAGDMS